MSDPRQPREGTRRLPADEIAAAEDRPARGATARRSAPASHGRDGTLVLPGGGADDRHAPARLHADPTVALPGSAPAAEPRGWFRRTPRAPAAEPDRASPPSPQPAGFGRREPTLCLPPEGSLVEPEPTRIVRPEPTRIVDPEATRLVGDDEGEDPTVRLAAPADREP